MNQGTAAHEVQVGGPPLPAADQDQVASRGRRWSALLNQIAAGDSEAFGTFYDETSRVTFGLIMHILRDREAAEEALVDVYVEFREQLRNVGAQLNPVSCLLSLARRTALARLDGIRGSSGPTHFPPRSPRLTHRRCCRSSRSIESASRSAGRSTS